MPNRSWSATSTENYRFGFNDQEQDGEVYGEANTYTFENRCYNPRLGIFFSVDPLNKMYPFISGYSYAKNSPILHIDLDGLGPVIVCYLYNDGEVDIKVSFDQDNMSDTYLEQQYIHGNVTLDQLASQSDIKFAYLVQSPDGTFREIFYGEWMYQAKGGENFNEDAVVDIASTAAGTAGDVFSTFYYGVQGEWTDAGYSAASIVIPFVGSKVLKGMGDAVKNLKRAEWIQSTWKLGNFARGRVFEAFLKETKYAKEGFEYVGGKNSGFFPTIDFYKNGLGVSLKTTNSASGFSSILKNVDDLAAAKKSGNLLGMKITDVRLDIGVAEGYDISKLNDIKKYADSKGVAVNIFVIQ